MDNFIENFTYFHQKCHSPHLYAKPAILYFINYQKKGPLPRLFNYFNIFGFQSKDFNSAYY